jgi:hypothetical protein
MLPSLMTRAHFSTSDFWNARMRADRAALDRVAVRHRPGGVFGAHAASGSGLVLDHEGGAERGTGLAGDEAPEHAVVPPGPNGTT